MSKNVNINVVKNTDKKVGAKVDKKTIVKAIAKADVKVDKKTIVKADVKVDKKAIAKADVKVDKKAIAKVDVKVDKKAIAKADVKVDKKTIAKADVKVDKKAKTNVDKNIEIMKNKILKHANDIWIPSNNLKQTNVKMNTWFDISESKSSTNKKFVNNNYDTEKLEPVKYCSKKIILDLTPYQKNIVNIWLNAYLNMYNIALKYIKNNIIDNKKVLNFYKLRALLKNEKSQLVKKSSARTHDIDSAIELACQNYKSAMTNYKNGNIKHFRIRYWKKNKKCKMMDLEKGNFNKKGMRKKILGGIEAFYDGEPYNFGNVDADCRLIRKENNYYLYVPEKIENEDEDEEEINPITLDPGIRTFNTGITKNKIVKIGENCGERIKEYLKRKDRIIGNDEISEKIKKKNEKMINKKISNLKNELHWKTINYLVNNNNVILIGNMSSKSIARKESNLNTMSKRIALSLSFYEFKMRLKYMCSRKGKKYGEINEWMTSKMCSICGNIKEDLGGNKIYDCNKCGKTLDRDVNGARNIYIKGIK